MSIILDALKKSETERQQQGPSEFSQVPIRPSGRRTPVWVWLLVALLGVNLVVLTGMFLRPAPQSAEPLTTTPVTARSTPTKTNTDRENVRESVVAAEPGFAEKTTAEVTIEPERPAAVIEQDTDDSSPVSTPGRVIVEPVSTAQPAQSLPDIDQLRASGVLNVPAQRLDIHVYSEEAANRFVFINMNKLREGATSDDGLTVEEITVNGVILRSGGRRFFLARQ